MASGVCIGVSNIGQAQPPNTRERTAAIGVAQAIAAVTRSKAEKSEQSEYKQEARD